ncbi:MAG: MFS transporter [Chloroflexota bacterium]
MSETTIGTSPIRKVLQNKNFRLLWLGEGISLLGDQFYLIALPWLILQMTGNAFAMGTVLAVAGIPRAIFMLLGGALTDRLTPRWMMLVTNIIRMGLVGLMAGLILVNSIELWMVYGFALLFGLADAFFFPAASAIVPEVVPEKHLQTGNTVIQATAQISVFLGPVLAGATIALFGNGDTVSDLRGIGLAFAFDALTFLLSAITLWFMQAKTTQPKVDTTVQTDDKNVWADMVEGLRFVWQDLPLRTVFIAVAAITIFATAPIVIGIPIFVEEHLGAGAGTFGILMAVFGAGTLLGTIASSVLPAPPPRQFGKTLFGIISTLGVSLALLSVANTAVIAGILLFAMGLVQGYVMIHFTTWLQRRSPPAMLGRVMSLLMFSFVGLAPVADTVFGALIEWNLSLVFLISGISLTLVSLLAMIQPSIQDMLPAPAGAMVESAAAD